MRRLVGKMGAVVLLVTSATAKAQQSQSGWELGVDGRLSHYFETPSTTAITAPLGQLRVGYFISPSLSLEPYGSVGYASTSNGLYSSSALLGAGLLFHFSDARAVLQPYVRPFAEYGRVRLPSGTNTTSSYGVGLGLKIPMMERMSWRLEGAYANGQRTGSRVLVNFGLSVFTR